VSSDFYLVVKKEFLHSNLTKKNLNVIIMIWVCTNRMWQNRRVVITKDDIIFAFVGEEAQIDRIPFAEVLYIKEMAEAATEDFDKEENKIFSHAMQIATRDDGYNSGRIYYLSADSQESLHELIEYLTKKAKAARAQVEARTVFRKFQLRVRKRYDSPQFQGLMALLITAVCSCSMFS
jgi:hypothetical protein